MVSSTSHLFRLLAYSPANRRALAAARKASRAAPPDVVVILLQLVEQIDLRSGHMHRIGCRYGEVFLPPGLDVEGRRWFMKRGSRLGA